MEVFIPIIEGSLLLYDMPLSLPANGGFSHAVYTVGCATYCYLIDM